MKLTTKWFGDQFNVDLSSAEGKEPFLQIKGCRVVSGSNGEFVSWPATKKDDGKYWRHAYASDSFNAAVLAEAKKSRPADDTRTHGQRKAAHLEDDIQF